jgi:hypothetical protein
MEKTLKILLSLLLFFSFSLCVFSQSSQKDLDQVKLSKQLLGTWEAEFATDSVQHIESKPSGEGQYVLLEWKSNGKTYATGRCLLGFTQKKESVVIYCIWPEGGSTKDLGKFVSETELVLERYLPDRVQPTAISKVEFPTPDTYTWEMHFRGTQTTWEPVGTAKWTFNKVK